MGCHVFVIIYSILQCIAFLFILVGSPIDQFRAKDTDVFSVKGCLTFWGYKEKCYSLTYNQRPPTLFADCNGRKTRFQAAEAFSIISIALSLLGLIFGFVQLCCCRCLRWVCFVLNLLLVGTVCVCWACMVSEYYNNRSSNDGTASANVNCIRLKDSSKYGAGFALYVTGWGLCFLNMIFILLPC